MGRADNIAIFENTRKFYQSDAELAAAIRSSNYLQEVILESSMITPIRPPFVEPAEIVVSRKRTFEAAQGYIVYPTCVLNFASATNPGGGVTRGSTAQEECLCRCSTLYANLTDPKVWKSFYEAHRSQKNQLYNDDCLYTPEVVVFKSDTAKPTLMHPDDWWKVNVITCAAPNLRQERSRKIHIQINDEELFNLHVKRMRRILNIAAMKENAVVILGAYGCGAFQNPPMVVASAMRQVVEEYRYHFRIIEFAVYCAPEDDYNYQVFNRVLGKLYTDPKLEE